MESKHTPGPWTCEQDLGGPFTNIGEPIAIIGGPETDEPVRFVVGRTCDFGHHGSEQAKANAILIAAAPQLLAALDDLVCAVAGLETYAQDGVKKEIAAAVKAIAKAEGK